MSVGCTHAGRRVAQADSQVTAQLLFHRSQPSPAGPEWQVTANHCCRPGSPGGLKLLALPQFPVGKATEGRSATGHRQRDTSSSPAASPPPQPSLTPSQHSGILPGEATGLDEEGQTKA